MSNNYGYTDSLQNFLSRYFPNLKLIRSYGSDTIEVWLPENPAVAKAEKAVDEAWERSNG